MRILFWNDSFWPKTGGTETLSFQLIESLREEGHVSSVVAQRDSMLLPEDEIYQGILIKRFDFNTIFPKKELKNLRPIQSYLERFLKEFKPDIVHLNACLGWSGFVFSLFRNLFPIPVVLTVHSPSFQDEKTAASFSKIFALADKIGCVSKWALSEIKHYVPEAKGKLRLIYNGSAPPKIPQEPLPLRPPALLLLGRLIKEKGFDIGIKAFSLLKKSGSNAKLIIAGGGPEKLRLQELVLKLGLNEWVDFKGDVPKENVHAILNLATIVMIPSKIEAFGLVALEAMQMRRPVIASKIGGLREVVLDDETGLFASPENPEAFFTATQTLLANPEKATQMGVEGQKRALTAFSLKRHTAAYINLYTESIEEWRASPKKR